MSESLIERLRKRAAIRRSIPRGEPDRISDILEEAAAELERLSAEVAQLRAELAAQKAEHEAELARWSNVCAAADKQTIVWKERAEKAEAKRDAAVAEALEDGGEWRTKLGDALGEQVRQRLRAEKAENDFAACLNMAAHACIERAAKCGHRAKPVSVGEVCANAIRALRPHSERCDECAPEWGCFDGSKPCSKKPRSDMVCVPREPTSELCKRLAMSSIDYRAFIAIAAEADKP